MEPTPGKGGMDADLQKEVDAALDGMSLDELMAAEEGTKKRRTPKRGATEKIIHGKVISIQGDDIFVDIGGRTDGLLPADQFEDEPLPEVGDDVEVTIEGVDEKDGLVLLSRKGAVLAATWDSLSRGQVVEARVTGHNKGGLELSINGIRGFMPISQVETYRVEDLSPYLHQKIQGVVQEIDYGKENIVVSHRELQDRIAKEKAAELWEKIHEGMIVEGTVRSLMPYGAFVDIGGEDGLLHISDMSHGRIDKPEDVVQPGQKIEVKVTKVDKDNKKISLGLKQIMTDPWEGVEQKYPPEEIVTGKVIRLAKFGAFIELEPGVEGLLPVSELSFEKHVGHPKEILSEGEMVKLRVLSVDPEKKRLSLSLKRMGDDPWVGASARFAPDTVVEGRVVRLAEFGAFVELAPGVDGLVHISELAKRHVNAPAEVVKEGEMVKARVLEVDEENRRIGLSIKRAEEPLEGMSVQDYQARKDQDGGKSKSKKDLKGGLDVGAVKTKFGELRLG
jgi:small subunit ribosomal protein S1